MFKGDNQYFSSAVKHLREGGRRVRPSVVHQRRSALRSRTPKLLDFQPPPSLDYYESGNKERRSDTRKRCPITNLKFLIHTVFHRVLTTELLLVVQHEKAAHRMPVFPFLRYNTSDSEFLQRFTRLPIAALKISSISPFREWASYSV